MQWERGDYGKGGLKPIHVNLYSYSNAMNMIVQTVLVTYLTMFMTDYHHISPMALGTGMLIAKTVDFLVGLITGIVIEQSHLKHGKYLSWIRLLSVTLLTGMADRSFSFAPAGVSHTERITLFSLLKSPPAFLANTITAKRAVVGRRIYSSTEAG